MSEAVCVLCRKKRDASRIFRLARHPRCGSTTSGAAVEPLVLRRTTTSRSRGRPCAASRSARCPCAASRSSRCRCPASRSSGCHCAAGHYLRRLSGGSACPGFVRVDYGLRGTGHQPQSRGADPSHLCSRHELLLSQCMCVPRDRPPTLRPASARPLRKFPQLVRRVHAAGFSARRTVSVERCPLQG
jgi:hypothetical protein